MESFEQPFILFDGDNDEMTIYRSDKIIAISIGNGLIMVSVDGVTGVLQNYFPYNEKNKESIGKLFSPVITIDTMK